MSKTVFMSEHSPQPSYWRDLSSDGLTDSDNRGLTKASLVLLGYLEDTENTCFKSKDVSDMTYGHLSSITVGRALLDIRDSLEVDEDEYNEWNWRERRGKETLVTRNVRESLSEHSEYFFDWD